MMKKVIILCLLISYQIQAQEKSVFIEEEVLPKKINLFAVNQTSESHKVSLEIVAKNVRKSGTLPVSKELQPNSKILMKTLIPIRGKKASYEYTFMVDGEDANEYNNKNAVNSAKNTAPLFTLYLTKNCKSCTNLLDSLSTTPFKHRIVDFTKEENKKARDLIAQVLAAKSISLDTLSSPVINYKGYLHHTITDYAGLKLLLNSTDTED